MIFLLCVLSYLGIFQIPLKFYPSQNNRIIISMLNVVYRLCRPVVVQYRCTGGQLYWRLYTSVDHWMSRRKLWWPDSAIRTPRPPAPTVTNHQPTSVLLQLSWVKRELQSSQVGSLLLTIRSINYIIQQHHCDIDNVKCEVWNLIEGRTNAKHIEMFKICRNKWWIYGDAFLLSLLVFGKKLSCFSEQKPSQHLTKSAK